ncbi:MAG: RNA polymerase sigma factor [Mycobacteriales bacterium]
MADDVVDEAQLRDLIPGVLAALVRRGVDFAAAEDAVQEALVRAVETWPTRRLDEPKGWLITTARRCFVDLARSDTARRHRELRVSDEPPPGPAASMDETLRLYFLCAHPSLSPASAVALTLRAVGGLTTRQIAQAYLVPETTMAQRILRAKRTVSDVRLDRSGDLRTVLRVLYLVFNEGYSGDVDLAAEAIRLARQLAATTDDVEVAGLLALFLLHHARRPARTRADGSLVPLSDQDRSLWRRDLITEGVAVLQAALARDWLGEYQAQAAIAALHADAPTADETDWVQIVEWYDELVRLTDSPVVRLNRAVAVSEADGPQAGLAALGELDSTLPRYTASSAYLHERAGDLATAARLYAEAAAQAHNLAERNHLTLRAATLNQRLSDGDC